MQIWDPSEPEMILMASGSEVPLIIEAGSILTEEGHSVRLVSFPSWELFEMQDPAYQESVLPMGITKRLVVEAGTSLGWHKYIGPHGKTVCMESFGTSGPADDLFIKYGFTVENVLKHCRELLS